MKCLKKDKIKILHIITSLSGGGAQQVLYRLILNSIKSNDNYEHEVLNLSGEGVFQKKLSLLNIKTFNVGIPRGSLFFINHIFSIINFLKKNDADIVQTWMYHADFLGGILTKLFTDKLILWNIRSANLSWELNRWHTVVIAKICCILSYFIPSKIISNSNEAITYHINYGYCKNKFELIFNGFDGELIKPNAELRKKFRSKFGICDEDIVIGNIARWDLLKDHKNLFKAFSKIKNKTNLKLFLIGENINSNNIELIKLIKKYSIDSKNIILNEQSDEIYDYINILDFSVISSIGESFPNVIPESMLTEIPIVSTEVGDVKNILSKEEGWLSDKNDSIDLFKKIELALNEFRNDKKKWSEKKINCRKKILNFFEIQSMLDKYNTLWKEVLNDRKYASRDRFINYKINDRKVRICHIISSMSHGGAQQVLARIIRSDKTNTTHEIISLSNLGRYGQELAHEGYNIISLNLSKMPPSIMSIYYLYQVLKKREYNLVQTWMYHADLLGGMFCYLLKKKIYWNIRNSDLNREWSPYLTIIIQKLCAFISKKVPYKIISCSEKASNIHQDLGYDSSKMKIIENGYNLLEFRGDKNLRINFRKKYEIKNDEFIFGMVARWDSQKDFKTLMNSIQIFFENNRNAKCKIFLAGQNISHSNIELSKLINEDISKKIELLGNLKDTQNFYNGIDCHILSSAGNEGFPNVVAEAMACELPCISTNVGDISKIIYDKNWIVPVKSPILLAKKMEDILKLKFNNINKFNDIKTKNRQHILNNFTIEKMLKSYHSCWFENK